VFFIFVFRERVSRRAGESRGREERRRVRELENERFWFGIVPLYKGAIIFSKQKSW